MLPREALRPQPCAACEFENVSTLELVSQCCLDQSDLANPLRSMLRAAIVTALSQKPLVVLACPSSVVIELLLEPVVTHLLGQRRAPLNGYRRVRSSWIGTAFDAATKHVDRHA
jgi:hypothetical protein